MVGGVLIGESNSGNQQIAPRGVEEDLMSGRGFSWEEGWEGRNCTLKYCDATQGQEEE
ncbi:hypothetical protein M408DRAFT_331698 [Serendipita vermifera MAFF 305830]|uniref:Uncharacterized protein n=1 Tax=Serendipita vermifera MAFF 305830 TaxID=933852 RepID=A0A0C3AJH0_SERVB|nr:hypothetical protein M408DRAFT_331698 [Serendipita vermifera MAFF 305830]